VRFQEIFNNKNLWTRSSEIWSLGAVLYFMMTGIPPPRLFEYPWQISRLNDKAFSPQLRELVAAMLNPQMERRPTARDLIGQAQDGWRSWRATTREGQEYVDGADKLLGEKIEMGKRGPARVGVIGAL
jgi:serine/threonine protein kinase